MAGPIATLVLARLRRRGATAGISVAAVAAAAALVAIVAGIGLVAADATLTRALDRDGPDRPVVRISRFAATARGLDAIVADAERAIGAHLGGFTTPVVRGLISRELLDLEAPVFELVVAIDDPGPWTTLLDGRMPAPCRDGAACEAILLSEVAPDLAFDAARPADGVELTIVGRGLLDRAVPFGELDQRGPFGRMPVGGGDYQTGRSSPAILLVDGVDALARSDAFDMTGRTYVWAAPLDVPSVHPWTASGVREGVAGLGRDLAADDIAFSVSSPVPELDAALGRAEAARGRLLLIGSLGVAILLAFAVFLALVIREDVLAESRRLSAAGARRRDRVAFHALEAVLPTLVGGALGWGLGAIGVAGLAAWSGVEPGPVLAGALFSPTSLAAAGVVLMVTIAATMAVTAPGSPGAGAMRVVAAAALTATVLLGWQLATSGPLEATSLAGSVADPIVIVLPPALAFVVALVLSAAMPPLLRALARRLGHAPVPIRLSLLSLSREPGRPAATLTLLAFSIGAIVFATAWSASLRQGIDDSAAYRSGLDLRVSELGSGLSISPSVVPLDRYAGLGDDLRLVPVYREASTTQPGGRVEILGIDPGSLATLPGWRDDFAPTPVAELAERLRLPAPGAGWQVSGHRLPAGERDLRLRFRYEGESLRSSAVVWTDGGDTTTLELGTIRDGQTEASARLPERAVGGRLVALIFRNDRIVAGSGHQHPVFRATVAFRGLEGLVDERPIDLEVFTVATVVIRAPQTTDGLVLPAIASRDLAAAADADGLLALHVGGGTIPVRVVGTAERAPTMLDAQPRFVVVPLEPFLVALAAAVPGAGRPSEMWIAAPSPERLAETRAALADAPFRFAAVTARADLVAARSGDPLSQAIVWALVVAAVAGLILSVGGLVLGAVTDLRDERGELADLEAQGVAPSALRRHVLARSAWLAIAGTTAGLVVGTLLAIVVTGSLALDADGLSPIPPLRVVIPVLPLVGLGAALVTTVLAVVAWLAGRTYGHPTLGERRAGRDRATRSAAWPRDAERVDG